jgi:hypothetical protein
VLVDELLQSLVKIDVGSFNKLAAFKDTATVRIVMVITLQKCSLSSPNYTGWCSHAGPPVERCALPVITFMHALSNAPWEKIAAAQDELHEMSTQRSSWGCSTNCDRHTIVNILLMTIHTVVIKRPNTS